MKINDYFLTACQAATKSGVTRVTICRWLKEEKFNGQRIGKEIFSLNGK